MFFKIAAFEFRYQLRQPVFWVVFALFFLLTFGSVVWDQISIGSGGNVHKNSPFAIAQAHLIWTIFFMFVTTAFVANVVVRDDDTGFGPIVRATPMSKNDYLYGRFTGAFATAALCFMSVPLAFYVGSLMPWIDPETLGPNRFEYYAFSFLVLALPGLFLTGALFFTLATLTRSMMWTYVGVVGFFTLYLISNILLQRLGMEQVAALAEPFGIAAYSLATRYWTAADRNLMVPALEGALLHNRLIWAGVGFAALAAAHALYRFEEKGSRKKKAKPAEAESPRASALAQPTAPKEGLAADFARLRLRTGFEVAQVLKSPAFAVLLALGLFNAFASLWFITDIYDGDVHPVTRLTVRALMGAFSLIPMIVAAYYAGELVWREREKRTHEIVDSTPAPDWVFVLPKALAIVLVLLATLAVSVAAAAAVQTARGFTDYQFDKYLLWYVLPQALDWTLLGVLAVFLQVIVPHKFLGWGAMLAYMVATIALSAAGFDHPLYLYGTTPPEPVSDMNGAGRFAVYAWTFRVYWSAFAVLMLVVCYGLWRRGTEQRILPRLRRLPRRLAGGAGVIAAAALVVFLGTGGWIYYNTDVLNEHRSAEEQERWLADYEKTLLPFETKPKPRVTDVRLDVDLRPHDQRLTARGSYVLENAGAEPLTELHLRFARDLKVDRLTMVGAEPGRKWERFNYHVLNLVTPMQPGERRTLVFETVLEQRGFRTRDNLTRIIDNGTFVNNFEFTPAIGMDRSMLLQDRAKRRKFGLPPEMRMAPLEDESARARPYIPVDWVNAEITVTTEADQTPIAPGYQVSDTTKDGRRTARFVTESPILHFFSIQSARYAKRAVVHDGVELAVYYHPGHPWNVDRMIEALRVGLDYYQSQFGPYQFRQARIIEFPGYGDFAQAFANTMPYSETIGFLSDHRDPEKVDIVTYVTAHELGHQWWAHQVIGADRQGATVLSETLASYSALMVMEKIHGPHQLRVFLKHELDRYLRARGGDPLGEQPLVRVEAGQGYIHYQKGGLVMYRLRDVIGEAAVNRALRRLVERYAFKSAPYPGSDELVALLREEAGPEHQDLITDLFERITLYDLKVGQTQVRRRADGRFDVTVTVEARKLHADAKGRETESPLAETFDLGLFTAEPGKRGFDDGSVILLERRSVRSGVQTFTFVTDRAPRFVGVDPYNKVIDRNSGDNVKPVG